VASIDLDWKLGSGTLDKGKHWRGERREKGVGVIWDKDGECTQRNWFSQSLLPFYPVSLVIALILAVLDPLSFSVQSLIGKVSTDFPRPLKCLPKQA